MAKQKAEETANVAEAAKPFSFEILEEVTVPLFKQVDDVPLFVRIEGEPFEGKEISGSGMDKPARLFPVTNLETGELGEIIANAVMESSLLEKYPKNEFVGKCFRILRSKIEGKRYKGYRISEIVVK